MNWNAFMRCAAAKSDRHPRAGGSLWQPSKRSKTTPGLLLPGAFFVAVGAQLFAAFMFIYFAFATFL
jgi:hypothetical protein